MVGRNPELIETMLELGVEATLRDVMGRHADGFVHNQAKAALTELRCNVNLKEAWKGTLEDAHILDQGDANGENHWDKWLETPVAQAAIRAEMEAEGILPDSYLDVKAPVNVS